MVSVICPVWNKSDLTHRFLFHHWRLYQSRPDIEFIIVNNGSTDNTPAVLTQWRRMMDTRLTILNLDQNTGFSGGHNRGADIAQGETLVFISNDVMPHADYVTRIEETLQPGMLLGPEKIIHDTGWNTFDGKTFPYLAGHLIASTRETWDKLGGWDERYFPCDYEDIDLSNTAREQEIILQEIHLPIRHLFGQSAQAIAGGREQITRKSREKFKAKWQIG